MFEIIFCNDLGDKFPHRICYSSWIYWVDNNLQGALLRLESKIYCPIQSFYECAFSLTYSSHHLNILVSVFYSLFSAATLLSLTQQSAPPPGPAAHSSCCWRRRPCSLCPCYEASSNWISRGCLYSLKILWKFIKSRRNQLNLNLSVKKSTHHWMRPLNRSWTPSPGLSSSSPWSRGWSRPACGCWGPRACVCPRGWGPPSRPWEAGRAD